MSTVFRDDVRSSIESRVRALRPDSPRAWGRMSPHGAICHLTDGFRLALGQKQVPRVPARFRGLMRFVALRMPMRWPRELKTPPEAEQGVGGTPPVEFEQDREQLLAMLRQFCAAAPGEFAREHPIFGAIGRDDWGRWAYRHMDHHLRQFGV